MKRRLFLQICGCLPFVKLLKGKEILQPSENDRAGAELWNYAEFATKEGPFILYRDIWFYAENNIIYWCYKRQLQPHYGEIFPVKSRWSRMEIPEFEEFDFWLKDYETYGDKLIWVGKHNLRCEVFESQNIPDCIVIQIRSYNG